MSFLEYSNKTQSNIIPKDEFMELVHEVFNVIATNVCKSLGPLGSSAIILEGGLTEATKDGYEIFSNYRFRNKYKRMIYNLMKAPCTRMNNTVGDGTTTVIALADALYDSYEMYRNEIEVLYRLPREFNSALDNIIHKICDGIKELATPIDPKDFDTIYNIAYVTSNGSDEISKNIAETYQNVETPSIKLKDSPTNKSYISPINGFEFPANLINEAYVRNQDGSTEEKNVHVMVFDHKIESDFFQSVLVPINQVMRAMKKKIIILAPFYDELMTQTVLDQYINIEYRTYSSLNMIMAKYDLNKIEPQQMTDLAVILKAKPITQDTANLLKNEIAENVDKAIDDILSNDQSPIWRAIGIADSVLLTCGKGSIFQVNEDIKDDRYYQELLQKTERELEDIKSITEKDMQSYSHKIYEKKARIMRLKMQNFIYYIGADSALQKKILWDSIDDVVKCTRSAIRYGIVPGCQLSIVKMCNKLLAEYIPTDLDESEESVKIFEDTMKNLSNTEKLEVRIIMIIMSAIGTVYGRILHGPDGMGMVKLIDGWEYTKSDEEVNELHKNAENKANDIIANSVNEYKAYDISKLELSDDIITSAETDIMALTAASELLKILISGNQCIILDPETDAAEDREMEVYV